MQIELLQIFNQASLPGRDGVAYSGELWVNGILDCVFHCHGNGSATVKDWASPEMEAAVAAYAAAQPNEEVGDELKELWPNGMPVDVDLLLALLCDQDEEHRLLAIERDAP